MYIEFSIKSCKELIEYSIHIESKYKTSGSILLAVGHNFIPVTYNIDVG